MKGNKVPNTKKPRIPRKTWHDGMNHSAELTWPPFLWESQKDQVEKQWFNMTLSLVHKNHARVVTFRLMVVALQDVAFKIFKYKPSVGSWLMPRQAMHNAWRLRICSCDRPCWIWDAEAEGREDEGRADETIGKMNQWNQRNERSEWISIHRVQGIA